MRLGKASSIWSLTLKDFRVRASSAEPTPGGGSVAIVAAVLGCTLISMALEISARKNKADSRLQNAMDQLRVVITKLTDYADADIMLFKKYLAAYRAPNKSRDKLSSRHLHLTEAAKSATEILFKAAEDIVSVIRLAPSLIDRTALNVVSDVGAGCAILDGALRALLIGISSNIRDLRPGTAAEFKHRRTALQREASALSRSIRGQTEFRLKEDSQEN